MNLLTLPLEMSSYKTVLQNAKSPFLVLLGFLVINALSWPLAAYSIVWFSQFLQSQINSGFFVLVLQFSTGLTVLCTPLISLYTGWLLIKEYHDEVIQKETDSKAT
ncbi:hypothetical protein L1D14_04170 [Vibrio tubiashii]|uniref:hypothetical protein n=1 Tax=Vibrio tubiashii TaxID=29498 RepID=UPI001EFCF9DB|nr:hypothetical protein [Vibrio tubiashii]MCG9575427.1 hypothetical protein [Vibrio tubiashii]